MKDYIDSGIIDAPALKKALDNAEDIVLLDGSYVLPGSDIDPKAAFTAKRIGHAQFFDIDAIADHTSDLPHMLPLADDFAHAASQLGISNDSLIVVYGQDGMIMGPARVWWTFKAFGHHNICVLNGGLPAWESAGFDINTKAPTPATTQNFLATRDPALVKNLDNMREAISDQDHCIIDARPAGRFNGEVSEPRAGLRSGHMPGSFNVPAGALVTENGFFKTESEILALFKDAGVDLEQNLITTCGSGVTACALSLALYHAGQKNSAVYDGSWGEWGKDDFGTPVI